MGSVRASGLATEPFMKRAFTLIELLVVIAIIAILAAILFPVFAQAKVAAKKTADLSNLKQIGTATQIYMGDSDDLCPLEAGWNQAGTTWNYNSRALVPADWSSVVDNRSFSATSLPNNSIYPYTKNYDMFLMPGASMDYQPLAANYFVNPVKKPVSSTYTFNGLLSSFSTTAVASVATTPIWWPGFSQAAGKGWSYANPFLACDTASAACVFQASSGATCASGNGGTSGMGTNTQGTAWCFGKGENWTYADGHAKFKNGLGQSLTNNSPKNDPWATYNAQGVPLSAYSDGCHTPLFRPDYQP